MYDVCIIMSSRFTKKTTYTIATIAESFEVEAYELFMFEEVSRRSERKAAIQELVKTTPHLHPLPIRA